MMILEALLIAILVVLFVDASISDLQYSKISNKSLLFALGIGGLCSVVYYAIFAGDCLLPYCINNGISILISLSLYALGVWGAGDSKLLIVTVLLFPARLYCIGGETVASCFILISIIFIVSYIYVVFDTVYVGIKQRDLFRVNIKNRSLNVLEYVKGIIFFFLMLSIIDSIVGLLPDNILLDSTLLTAIHFVVILLAMKIVDKTNWIVVSIMSSIWILLLLLGVSKFGFGGVDWLAYALVVLLFVFRLFADKYNYKVIAIEDLKVGMILSLSSTLEFSKSRIKGLPEYSTEDLKSRLCEKDIDSIKRWSKSNNGKDKITIVRKIPFALFIGLGTVIFAVLEVLIN